MSDLQKYSDARRLFDEGHPSDAIPHLLEYCKADANDLSARLLLGECYQKLGRADLAGDVFCDVLLVDPTSIAALKALESCGRELVGEEETDGAELNEHVPVDVPGTESRESRGKNPRWREGMNPIDWWDSLRRGIGRDPKKQKQKLYSDEKSKQRAKNELDRIKSRDDVADSPVTKNAEDEDSGL